MSLSKQNFSTLSEESLNAQITKEHFAAQTYLSMAAWFDRDTVALPGFAKFCRESAQEERDHGGKIIDYINQRGGRVVLQSIEAPTVEWGSAQNAVESMLQLEKDVNKSLLQVHRAASESEDAQMCDYLEGHFLTEQVESIKKLADLLTKLNRVGSEGLGLYLLDKEVGEMSP